MKNGRKQHLQPWLSPWYNSHSDWKFASCYPAGISSCEFFKYLHFITAQLFCRGGEQCLCPTVHVAFSDAYLSRRNCGLKIEHLPKWALLWALQGVCELCVAVQRSWKVVRNWDLPSVRKWQWNLQCVLGGFCLSRKWKPLWFWSFCFSSPSFPFSFFLSWKQTWSMMQRGEWGGSFWTVTRVLLHPFNLKKPF